MRQPVAARARSARAQTCDAIQEQFSDGTATEQESRHDRVRRSTAARLSAGLIAVLSWLGPVQISWQTARDSAATIATHGNDAEAMRDWLASWRTTGRLLVRWGVQQAQAGAITDPTAPIRFTPTITQTTGQGGGVPVLQITTPNQNGLSYNLLQSLTVDATGLVMNNSLTGGGTFLGGNVAGNPNLVSSGPASTILTQITGTAPLRINGTVEVFGAPASVIFAAPSGVYLAGAGFTNTPSVSLVTGTPQFLNSSGAVVGFDQATAVGYTVNSGRIQIDPVAGTTSGAGIEGTVGAINLIGQTIGVNAPLYAGQQINAIAGNQQVTPVATGTGRAGSDWQVTSTGPNTAANSPTAQNGLAIDATAFGAMTAGQIKIISTAQGLGVRAAGDLAANTSNVNIDANGNVTVGNVYGQQNVGITSTGAVSTTGTTRALQDVSVSASGDVNVGGATQAGNNLTLNAGGNLTGAGNLGAANTLSATAGNSLNLTGNLNAANIAVSAQGRDGTGDVALDGVVSSPNTIALTATRDLPLAGRVTTNGDLQASAGRDISIAGTTQSTGATMLTAARDIGVTSTGAAIAGTTLTATAGRNLDVSGGTGSGGDTTLAATGGTLSTAGTVLSGGNVTATGQTGTTLGGSVYAAQDVNAQSSAGTTSATGSVIAHSGNVALTGTSVSVSGSTQSGSDTTLNATHGSGQIDGQAFALDKLTASATQDITGQGRTASIGDTTLAAGNSIALTGSSQTSGNLSATATNGVAIAALPVVGGNATLSGTNVSLGGIGATSQVNGTLTATGSQSVATAGTINTNTASLTGGTVTNTGTVTASTTLTATGTTITNTGSLGGVTTTVHGTDVVNVGLIGGQTVNVTADNSLNNQSGTLLGTQTLNVTTNSLTSNQNGVMFAGSPSGTTSGGDLTLSVTGGNGSFDNMGGQILSANNATLNLQNQTIDRASNQGTVNAGNQLTYNVGAVANTGAWTLGGKTATINAANGIANSGSIQHAGDLMLNTAGAVNNSGQIIAGHDLTVSGSTVNNAAGATLHADNDATISGATVNRGTVEALNDVKIAGAGYDNSGGLTQANRDVNVNVLGDVVNGGGTIGAKRDVNLKAGRVLNDAVGGGSAVGTTVITGQEINPTYLSQIVIGTKQVMLPIPGAGSADDGPQFGPYTFAVTIGDLKPDANGVISGYQGVETYTPANGGGPNGTITPQLNLWHLGGPPDTTSFPSADYRPAPGTPAPFITLPTLTRTETTTQDGVSGIIQAGRNLSVTASTLSNNGGQISAANDIKMAVGTLNNGASAGSTKTITESITQASLNAFMQQLAIQLGYSPQSGGGYPLAVLNDGCLPSECNNSGNGNGPPPGAEAPHWVWFGPSSYMRFNGDVTNASGLAGFTATPPAPQSTVQQTAGKQGVIAAGGNIDLTQVGTLNNGGQIAAAGNVSLGGSVNNVGQLNVNRTTLPGCVGNPATCTDPGVSGGGSPYYEAIDPKQQVASIVAGGTLTANVSQLTNQTGTLAANGNVQITAPTATNTGATIQSSAGSVTVNAVNGLVNQAAPTTTVYASHGPDVAPCGKSGSGTCATATQTATGDAGMILAAGDLTINAGAVRNNGGAIVAGGNNTITTDSFDNSSIFLRQYYHWSFFDQNSNASDRWGCDSAGDISGCQRVFGSNLTNGTNANAENAPTIGVLNSYVSGGNLAIRSGGALVNSGNIQGTAISLSGATITNGITNPSIQTPPSTSNQEVVSLGPIGTPNAQLPVTGTPDTFSGPTTVLQKGVPNPSNPGASGGQWQFNPVVVTAANGQTVSWHFTAPLDGSAVTTPGAVGSTAQYLTNSPATAVLGGVGPATLINALPADLRPGSTPFYYDPQAENKQLDQAALARTGRSSFVDGLTYDNQHHWTVDDQEKLVLYNNAVDYAKAHNIQLGQALTSDQVAGLDKPILWYVTQQVPDPNCMSGACPMVSALVPQVYLPPGYSGIEPGGSIVASKSLDLIANNPIQNTGTLGSYGTLTTNTTIVNEQRSAEMTAAWQPIEDGWARTTGQVGQANSGFVFAANAADIAGQVQNINGVLAQLNADGSMSAEESARVVAAIQAGRAAVSDRHTDTYVREEGWAGQLFSAVVIIAIGIMSGGAAMAAYAGVGATLTVGEAMAQAAITSMTTNAMQQASSGMGFSFGAMVKAGATSALTAGLTQGITIDENGVFGTVDGLGSVASDRSIAELSGTKAIGDGLTQAGTATGTLGEQIAALAIDATIKAGVSTGINGGSFLTNLRNSAVNDLAAAAAYGIGNLNADDKLTGPAYYLAHALLGCASAAATGGGCGGGAIGGALSAATTDAIAGTLSGGQGITDSTGVALMGSMASLLGGTAAGLAGQDVQAGSTAAQNEAMNNNCGQGHDCGTLKSALADTGRAGINTVIGIVEAIPNALNGALPGYPDYVQFLNGARLPYDNPDFGDLVSFLGAVGFARATGAGTKSSAVSQADLNTLAANGVKFNPENVVATATTSNGRVVFLETGNSRAGLQHIVESHASDFANIGVSEAQIPNVVMKAVKEGDIVGYQGSGTGRPIYQTTINGQPQRIAVTVGSNGFIVGANPAGRGR